MKRLLLTFLFLIALTGYSYAASYFWVGGTGTWDNASTAHWSTSSGGGAGAGPPTASDTATFDGSSGTGTVTIASTAATSALAFGGANITTSFSGGVTFGTVTITAGTFVTGSNTHSFTSLTSNSGTRTLTLTNSTINITGTSGTPWNVATGGTLTLTATGSTININGGTANGALSLTFGTYTLGTLNITAAGLISISGSPTCAAFNYTSTVNKTDYLQSLSSPIVTIAAAGSLTIAGNSSVNRAFVKSSALGTQRTISVPSGATVTLTNVDFQDTASAGTFGTWTGTSLGDALGNSGITFDGSTTQTLTATGTINWSTAANWTSRVPLPQDDVVVNYSGGSATTLTADMPRLGRNINFTGYTKIMSFASTPNTIFGNIALASGATFSGTQNLTLAGRGAQTITSAGNTFPGSITMTAFGGTYALQDNFSNTGFTLTLNNGTWDIQSFTSTHQTMNASGSGTKVIQGSGTINIAATSGVGWNATGGGLSLFLAAATIKLTGAVSANTTFSGSGLTYGNFWWSNTASTGTLIITGANTFADFKVDGTTARTVQFPSSTTTIVNTFTQSNVTPGVQTTINSSSAGTRATLQSRGPAESLYWLSIKDINALGGAGWYAGDRSTNTSNNYGWQYYRPGTSFTVQRQHHSANDNVQTAMAA